MNEFVHHGQKIWEHLDELHSNNPKAYEKLIENAKKQFSKPQQSTLLEPGYCLVCSASSNPRLVFINIAKSLKIAAPPKDDPLNIPMCLSKVRKHKTDKGDHARVIDCIVNNSVFADCEKDSKFKRDIIDLALQSVQEAEIKELQLNVNNLLKNHYEGPIGWDDSGKPFDEEKVKEKLETKSTSDITLGGNDWFRDTLEIDESTTLKLPSGKIVGSGANDEPVVPEKVLIEEIGGLSLHNPEEELVDPNGKPDCKITETDGEVTYRIHLPHLTSGKDVEAYAKDGRVFVNAGKYDFDLQIPSKYNTNSIHVKFIKSKSILKLKLEALT